jgi:hypothetical protein
MIATILIEVKITAIDVTATLAARNKISCKCLWVRTIIPN